MLLRTCDSFTKPPQFGLPNLVIVGASHGKRNSDQLPTFRFFVYWRSLDLGKVNGSSLVSLINWYSMILTLVMPATGLVTQKIQSAGVSQVTACCHRNETVENKRATRKWTRLHLWQRRRHSCSTWYSVTSRSSLVNQSHKWSPSTASCNLKTDDRPIVLVLMMRFEYCMNISLVRI